MDFMKRIEATIRPYKQEQVLQALAKIGNFGVTVREGLSSATESLHSDLYQSAQQGLEGFELVPRHVLVMYVEDEQVDEIVNLIVSIAQTGKIGDGRIAVLPLDRIIRIRTGEEGSDAL